MEKMISQKDIEKIGAKLRELREKKEMSQQQFAAELFWELSTYQKIESGKVLITTDKAIQIRRMYGVDLNCFLDDAPYDNGDSMMDVIINGTKEESTKMLIRVLEYFIGFLKRSLRK